MVLFTVSSQLTSHFVLKLSGGYLLFIKPGEWLEVKKNNDFTLLVSVSSNFQRVFKRPGLYRDVFSCTKEGHPLSRLNLSECLYENKLTRFSEPTADNSFRACSDCLALTELTRLRGWLYQWKNRVTPPTEHIFYISCRQFVTFYKEMYERLARRPG